MKKNLFFVMAMSGGLLLAGCGSDSSNTNSNISSDSNSGSNSSSETPVSKATTFSLGVSDAPVDEANKVVLAFKDVVLVPLDPETGQPTGEAIPMDVSEKGELRKINLLEFQGSDAETIIGNQEIEPGNYALCVYAKDGKQINDDSLSYVEKTDGSLKGLVVPSKGSCHGYKPSTEDQGRLMFSQEDEYVKIHAGHNSYVVEFDLRKGLADPRGLDYMLMNSNAVSLVNASESGHINGEVSSTQYQACEADSAALNAINNASAVHAVYLYAGTMDRTSMGDLGVTDPSLKEPVAVASVNESSDEEGNPVYKYEFGYIGPGSYSIGYTCTAFVDAATSHETSDNGFSIYQHYTPVEVKADEYTKQDITPIL